MNFLRIFPALVLGLCAFAHWALAVDEPSPNARVESQGAYRVPQLSLIVGISVGCEDEGIARERD